ncbi:MAG: hypothetical protein JXR40_08070 [Pontiellaceae bacterium]|nr:hypothetical protein [Pontiellaceae bacterium]
MDQLVSERIQSGGGWTEAVYGYDANGCLTNQQSAVGNRHYQYDYDNRLTSVDSASSSVEYLYDASGARIGRIVEATPSSLSTNYFVIDHPDALKRPLAETDALGNVIRFYVWNGARLLCHIEANGTVRYYHADELGSTLALTDASGNVTDQFAYMPYGYANHSGSTTTPFQWLGGYGVYYDSATDLHLTLHRAYSSTMKRFIHPDPLGIDGGPNVYVYANQNPLFFVDPSGEIPVWLITGGIGAVIGGGIGFFGELLTGGDLQSASAAGLAGLAGGFAMGSGASLIAGAGLGTFATVGGLATLGATTEGLSNVGEQVLDDRFHNRNVDINGNEVALAAAFGGLAGLGDAGVEIGKRVALRHIDDGYQMTKKYLNDIGQSYAAEGASRGTRDALLQPHYWRNAQLRDLSSDSVRRTADRLGTYYLPVIFGGLSAAQSLYSNGGGSLK